MVIPINKQGGRATYYYPGDGYLRRYDDFGVTQISLEAWTRRQDAEKAFWGGSVRWVDDPTDPPLHPSIGLVQRPLARVINDDLLPMPAARRIAAESLSCRACGVHGVAPHIVDELVRANDPGCDRAGMDADPRLHFQLCRFGNGGYSFEHARRKRGNAVCVVGLSFGNSGSDHVGVANGLDLFHTVFRGEAVEC
jgi:hypothetical protein